MDAELREELQREILNPILTAIAAHYEDQEHLTGRCMADQLQIRQEFAAFLTRLESLEASRSAFENRHNGHERQLREFADEVRRSADQFRTDVFATIGAAATRHNELAGKVDGVAGSLDTIKDDVKGAVNEVVLSHVDAITKAAKSIAAAPRNKSIAALVGTGLAAAVIEIVARLLSH